MAKIIDATSKLLEASTQFKSTLKSLLERESAADKRYEAIRARLKIVLSEYCDQPATFALVARLNGLMREMEDILQQHLSPYNSERARGNIVYMASQAYRSNYSSYLAGKWSCPKDISPIVKTTMHNAAADSSISLYEGLQAILDHVRNTSLRDKGGKTGLDDITIGTLGLYCDGALADAKKFLDFADDYVENAPLTAFNRGKFAVLEANSRQEVKEGLALWKALPDITVNPHPAELVWHDDNYKSLAKANHRLRKKIQQNGFAGELKLINGILEHRAQRANGMFEEQLRKHIRKQASIKSAVTASVAVSAASVIFLSAAFAYGHEIASIFDHIKSLMSAHSELSQHAMSLLAIPETPIQLAAAASDIGGGGVLNAANFIRLGGGGVL